MIISRPNLWWKWCTTTTWNHMEHYLMNWTRVMMTGPHTGITFSLKLQTSCTTITRYQPVTLILLQVSGQAPHNDSPPSKNARDLYDMIVATPVGDIPWQSFSLKYTRPKPKTLGHDSDDPSWTTTNYDIWFCDPHLLAQATLNSTVNLISHLTRNTVQMANIALRIWCQEIGSENRWWVGLKLF